MAKKNVFVLGTVNGVLENYSYPCCRNVSCYRRVRVLDENQKTHICNKCCEEYKEREIIYRYRVTLLATDTTQTAEIAVFGSCLDQFFGCNATEFNSVISCLESEFNLYGVSISKLVHQAMEQCFIGSSLQFGFRFNQHNRGACHGEGNTPVKFANITSRNFQRHTSSAIIPRLTACLVVNATPTETFFTVLDILSETVRQIWGDSPYEKLSISNSCQKQCYGNLQINPILLHNRGRMSENTKSFPKGRPLSTTPLFASQLCTPRPLYDFVPPLVLDLSSTSPLELGLSTSKDIYQSVEDNEEAKQSTPLNGSLFEYQRETASTDPFVTANEMTKQNCLINPKSPIVIPESRYSNLGMEEVQVYSSSENLSILSADLVLDDVDQPLKDEEQSTNENTSVSSKENERFSTSNATHTRFGKSLGGVEEIMKENSWLSLPSRPLQSETNCIEESSDMELSRCADALGSLAVTPACQMNSPMLLYGYEHDTMLLQNHSESLPKKKKFKTDGYNEDSVSDVSDFPSSEDLEVFLANFESSFFQNEASRISFLNKSTEFTKAKESPRKDDELNNTFHNFSHQEQILAVPTGVNINTNHTDQEVTMALRQSTWKCKTVGIENRKIGNTFIRKLPFERNNIFTVDGLVSDGYQKQHLQCGGKTVFSNEKYYITPNQCDKDTSKRSETKKKWKFEYCRGNGQFQPELEARDGASSLIEKVCEVPWIEGNRSSMTPNIFPRSFPLGQDTPSQFDHSPPEESFSLQFAEDMQSESSLLLFSGSASLNESPVHSNFVQTRNNSQKLPHVRNHSTPLPPEKCVNRTLFSPVDKRNSCFNTPVTGSAEFGSANKLSSSMNLVTFSTNFDSDILSSPLLFSMSPSNICDCACSIVVE